MSVTWAAPGRVNVIGEHTDYNDGFVLPIALPRRTIVTAVPAAAASTARSALQSGEVVFDARTVEPGEVSGWGAYVAGVVWALRAGQNVGNVSLSIDSDVPHGAGLSSSAALTCAVAAACSDLFDLGLGRSELAAVAQRAENDFVGMPCGIMDQMAAMHSAAGHALFLDTRSLEITHVPFDLAAAGLALLVVDTRAPHRLVDGEYAARRADCEAAAEALGVPALRDASESRLGELPESVRRRARHVVTENGRVLEAVAILQDGHDPRRLGPLLTASHESLRDDFEVSVAETDLAVESLLDVGAYGARITGGGFGGCVIGLVDTGKVARATESVTSAFKHGGLTEPHVFTAVPSAGAERLQRSDR